MGFPNKVVIPVNRISGRRGAGGDSGSDDFASGIGRNPKTLRATITSKGFCRVEAIAESPNASTNAPVTIRCFMVVPIEHRPRTLVATFPQRGSSFLVDLTIRQLATDNRRPTAYKFPMQRIVALIFALLSALSLHAANNKLNLFIWSEYIDPEIISDFEKRHDAKVIIDLYEDEAAMLAKLQAGGASQYDVIVPPDHTVPALIKLKLIAPLRHDNIANIRHIDERFASPWYDPSNRYTVPYQWGTVGIYARKPADKPYIESWALLFDEKEQPPGG